MKAPTIDYRITVYEDHTDDGTTFPITDLSPEDLEPYWGEHTTCCGMQGGFYIHADGVLWNEDAVDEIRMSSTWLPAVRSLLEGHHVASVWAWEESGMTLVRRGDQLEMFDVHHSGHVVCGLVRFDLRDFAIELAAAAETAMEFFEGVLSHEGFAEIRETLVNNLPSDWMEQAATICELATAAQIPESAPHARPAPPTALLALELDDFPAFRRALDESLESVHAVHDQTTLLNEAVGKRRTVMVAELLRRGADPNQLARGRSVLGSAVMIGELPMVRMLLAAGASPEFEEIEARPARLAAFGVMRDPSRRKLFNTLLEAGAAYTVDCAVLLADFRGIAKRLDECPRHPDLARLAMMRFRAEKYTLELSHEERVARWKEPLMSLVAAGVDPQPALMEAILSEDLPTVQFAIAVGADAAGPVDDEPTAAAYASRFRLGEIAEYLGGGSST